MIEKPQILSDEQIKKANERVLSRHGIPCEPITVEDVIRIGNKLRLRIIEEQNIERLKAQLDAAVAYYEPLIQQARQEVADKIFEEIEAELVAFEGFSQKTQHQAAIINTNWYQSLKSRFGGKK
jgi:predicted Ser/Thr protein kinase